MLKATKKVYMSILAILLVFITVVATTFAWVGILTYAQTDSFKINLKTQELDNEYYLTISATGKSDDFSNIADTIELKKQILQNLNRYISDETIERDFDRNAYLTPSTASSEEILEDTFHVMDRVDHISTAKSASYYKFDIYLSLEHREGDSALSNVDDFSIDVVLTDIDRTITGEISKYKIPNEMIYNPSNMSAYGINTNISKINPDEWVTIDSASAARLAFAVYEPIQIDDEYDSSHQIVDFFIYQGGTQNPTYYEESKLYSFGGILPEEYNLALYEHKKVYNLSSTDLIIPDNILNRNDLELKESNKEIIKNTVGFGIKNKKKQKIKITTYFWIEGWDSDCFEIIDGRKFNINMSFIAGSNIL